jgi:Astacin (Peptidase family M12A)
MTNPMVCTPKHLPIDTLVERAKTAVKINPLNHVPLERLTRLMPDFQLDPMRIAVMTKKYWGIKGVRLTVSFLDNPPTNLRKRIIQHMNAWNQTANVQFVETKTGGQVRIARAGGEEGGYWSYVGTDIVHINKKEQTMNLEEFTMDTPESEFHRVVRHETGHTLGFPHEHMRKALVALIDPDKAIAYFMETQGWSEAEVRAQVLTPLEESSLLGTAPDPKSIMCYQIPGQITKSGKPIIGGIDISPLDFSFVSTIYPKTKAAPAKKAKPKK